MFGNIFKKTYSIALAVSIVCCVSPLAFFTSSVNEGDSAQVTQEDLHDLAMEIAFMVNEARTENGLKPLYIVPHLCDYSHVRVRESVHKFSHFRPTQAELSGSPDGEEGENFDSYLRDENYPYLKAAENLAASEDPCTSEDAFYQWQSSTEGHWEAILDPDMTHMGVAVTYEHKDRNSETYQDDPFEWYWELLMIQASPETAVILQYIEYQDALAKMKAGKEYDESILDRPVTFNALQIEAADCFKDGVININDAKVLQKFVLGEVKTLPYEF